QTELVREVVRVNRFEAAAATLFEEEETALAHFGERRHSRPSVEQKRDEVVARGPHARVLVINYPQAPHGVHHKVRRVKVSVAERARSRGQLRRNVVQLRAQLRFVAVLKLLAAQALEVVLHEEVQLPRELRLVEGEAAGDGLALVGERGRRLYVGDESDGLLDVRFALVLRGRLED